MAARFVSKKNSLSLCMGGISELFAATMEGERR